MVRLKEAFTVKFNKCLQNFNSTMVRLKVVALVAAIPVVVFQFHYGSVKRKSASTNVKNTENFNSTMVRLKVSTRMQNLKQSGYFNSTMVRLKDCGSYWKGLRKINFNSTMVRLKVLRIKARFLGFIISIPLWFG